MSEREKKPVVKEGMPRFRTEDEERDFWAEHDVVDYFDWDKSVEGSFPALKASERGKSQSRFRCARSAGDTDKSNKRVIDVR